MPPTGGADDGDRPRPASVRWPGILRLKSTGSEFAGFPRDRYTTLPPEIAEIWLSAPNRHHFLVDLAPFGLDNQGATFQADDRPYGLIQCAAQRDDAPPAGPTWGDPATFA